jgi:hypothetical protein
MKLLKVYDCRKSNIFEINLQLPARRAFIGSGIINQLLTSVARIPAGVPAPLNSYPFTVGLRKFYFHEQAPFILFLTGGPGIYGL